MLINNSSFIRNIVKFQFGRLRDEGELEKIEQKKDMRKRKVCKWRIELRDKYNNRWRIKGK